MRTLETERLILREWEPEDADFVLDLYSRWEVQRFIGNHPQVMRQRTEAEERIPVWRAMDLQQKLQPRSSPTGWTAAWRRSWPSQPLPTRHHRGSAGGSGCCTADRPASTTTPCANFSRCRFRANRSPSTAAATSCGAAPVPAGLRHGGRRGAPASALPPPPRPGSW